jgi:hypothetical protein
MSIMQRTLRKGRTGWRGRGLGVVSTVVNGSLVYGSSPIASRVTHPVVRPIGPARYIGPAAGSNIDTNPISTTWGSTPNYPGQPIYSGGGSYVNTQSASSTNLAQLTLLYQENPSSLTAAQWSQLQAAGIIPETVPYGDASLISGASAAALATAPTTDTTTAAATSTILGTDPTNGATTIFGIDWYWLAGGGVVLALLFRKKGR